jgi:hypothetical protein
MFDCLSVLRSGNVGVFRFMRMWECGFEKRWLDRYRGPYEQCIVKSRNPRMTALKLPNFHSAFIVLFLGLGISLVAFAIENATTFVKNVISKRIRGPISK